MVRMRHDLRCMLHCCAASAAQQALQLQHQHCKHSSCCQMPTPSW
jgi:hypothetical protein